MLTKALLQNGAELALVTRDGFTPLACACGAGAMDTIPLLLAAGADADGHYEEPETLGSRVTSPVEAAARHGHLAVVEALLHAGAKHHLRAAEEAAREGGHSAVADLLKDWA